MDFSFKSFSSVGSRCVSPSTEFGRKLYTAKHQKDKKKWRIISWFWESLHMRSDRFKEPSDVLMLHHDQCTFFFQHKKRKPVHLIVQYRDCVMLRYITFILNMERCLLICPTAVHRCSLSQERPSNHGQSHGWEVKALSKHACGPVPFFHQGFKLVLQYVLIYITAHRVCLVDSKHSLLSGDWVSVLSHIHGFASGYTIKSVHIVCSC